MTGGEAGDGGGADADVGVREVLEVLTARHRWMVAALTIASLAAGLLESVILVVVAQVAAAMVDETSRLQADLGPLDIDTSVRVALGVACVCAVARLVLQLAVAYLPARMSADIQAELRNRLLDRFSAASWGLQAEEREGDLQEMVSTQAYQGTQGVLQAGVLLVSASAFLALLASAVVLSVPVALLVVGLAGLLSFVLRPLNRLGRRHGRALSAASLTYADGVNQAVRVAEEAHVFGVSATQARRVRRLADEAGGAFFRMQFMGRLAQNLHQSLAVLLIVLGLAGLYVSGTGRIATLGAVVLMLVRSAAYAQQAHVSYHFVQQAAPFLERLMRAEARYAAAAIRAGDRTLGAIHSLRCERVGFAYPRGTAALTEVSFDVAMGDTVGVVGPSGAGKSTLVQVILRLREPTSGAYTVNGSPASEFALDEWRRRVAYVPQDPKLLDATVADNIRFLRELDDEAVVRAARLAHVHDDIVSWPAGYDTEVGQRVGAVSGGQRQRICLARALAGEPLLLVLDEPTSALDLRSESLIQESLASLRGHVTLVVVSHRLSTLSICDRVMVMAGGRVEAFGPSPQLELSNAFYRNAVDLTARTAT